VSECQETNIGVVCVQLYVWRENDQVPAVRRCRWVLPRTSLKIDHFDLSADYLAVVSTDGQAFTGSLPVARSSSHHSPRPGDCHFLVTLIPRLHNTTGCTTQFDNWLDNRLYRVKGALHISHPVI